MYNSVIAQLAARRQLAIGVEGEGFEYLVGRRKFGDLFGLPLGGGQARESELVVRFSESLDCSRQALRALLGGGLAGSIESRLRSEERRVGKEGRSRRTLCRQKE